MIGSDSALKVLDKDTLEDRRQPTILDIIASNPKNKNNPQFDEVFNYLRTNSFDIHFDFSHRTPIHDCLDNRNLE